MTNQDIDELAARMSIRLTNMPLLHPTMELWPKCAICNQAPEHYGNGYIMPYGSIYDGSYVCGECLIKALDIEIADAKARPTPATEVK